MEKIEVIARERRLPGIGIFGRLGIVFSVYGILVDLLKFKVDLIATVISLIFIFSYYNLLKLKNWSRILLLISNGIMALLSTITNIIALSLPFKTSFEIYKQICPLAPILAFILFLISSIYYYGFLIYFTRSSVKEQFKQKRRKKR